MTRPEFAQQLFCALLARDPLPAQRYTEIDMRLEQLAHIAQLAAVTFEEVEKQWNADSRKARAVAQRIWDYNTARNREIPVPEKLRGAAGEDAPPMSSLFDRP